MTKATGALLLVLLAVAGCRSDSLRQSVAEAESRWNAQEPSQYSILYSMGCFCFCPSYLLDFEDGSLQHVTAWPSGMPMDVEDECVASPASVFAEIYHGLDNSFAIVEVAFDPHYGYPTQVCLDRDPRTADGGICHNFNLVEFNGRDYLTELKVLDRQVALWESQGLPSYQLLIRRGESSLFSTRYQVVVEDGEVVQALRDGRELSEHERWFFQSDMTVTQLFEIIRGGLARSAHRVEVAYDQTGVPHSIQIQWIEGDDDASIWYRIELL